MTWTILIASSLYWFLPAYGANIASTLAGTLHLPFAQPLSTPLFGRNKTVRGLYAGVLAAVLMVMVQRTLQAYGIAESVRLMDYAAPDIWMLGLLLGTGAVLGDIAKSFFKRRLGKPEGSPWVPFDQLDFVVGALLFTLPFYPVDVMYVIVILIFSPLLHFIVNVMGYVLGVKKVWW